MSGGLVGFNWACKWFLAQFKNSVHIIVLDFFRLFWAILKPNQQLYVIGPINLVFLAIFLLFI
jgi:hypothetical protein